MQLTFVDWLFVLIYFIISIGIGLYFSRKAGASVQSFFVSGRSLPRWLVGTSMVATISTSLNPGTSYIVNDFYIRFLKRDGDQRHYVTVARIVTFLIMLAAAVVTLLLTTIVGAYKFIMTIGAGTGLVYILRWFWWRINAWSEVTAMAASLVVASTLMAIGYSTDTNEGFTVLMLVTTVLSTAAWVTVTFLTKPVSMGHLQSFYRRVQPGGRLWKHVSDTIPADELKHPKPHIGIDFMNWILGSFSVWLFLFGIGKIILGPRSLGFIYLALGGILFFFIYLALTKKEKACASGIHQ